MRPFRSGLTAVATAEGFLRHFGEMQIVEVSYDIAREGARIRAAAGVRTPDALIIATAVVSGADVLVTNDRSWRLVIAGLLPELRVVVLSERPS